VPVYLAQRLTTGGDARSATDEAGTLTAVAVSQSI
jgi:hypothetical protein